MPSNGPRVKGYFDPSTIGASYGATSGRAWTSARHQKVGRPLDSDLAESISALKEAFEARAVPLSLGDGDEAEIASLRSKLELPRRYRDFLGKCDPVDLETRTPAERVRLIPTSELLEEQKGYALDDAGEPIEQPSPSGWRSSWVIIGHSSLLGDPYFLDVAEPDAEGDCPVYTAMSGTETWQPRLCASSFAMFLRILAVSMQVAGGFADDDIDMDDEEVFREALGPKIRQYDPAAVKAGHWT